MNKFLFFAKLVIGIIVFFLFLKVAFNVSFVDSVDALFEHTSSIPELLEPDESEDYQEIIEGLNTNDNPTLAEAADEKVDSLLEQGRNKVDEAVQNITGKTGADSESSLDEVFTGLEGSNKPEPTLQEKIADLREKKRKEKQKQEEKRFAALSTDEQIAELELNLKNEKIAKELASLTPEERREWDRVSALDYSDRIDEFIKHFKETLNKAERVGEIYKFYAAELDTNEGSDVDSKSSIEELFSFKSDGVCLAIVESSYPVYSFVFVKDFGTKVAIKTYSLGFGRYSLNRFGLLIDEKRELSHLDYMAPAINTNLENPKYFISANAPLFPSIPEENSENGYHLLRNTEVIFFDSPPVSDRKDVLLRKGFRYTLTSETDESSLRVGLIHQSFLSEKRTQLKENIIQPIDKTVSPSILKALPVEDSQSSSKEAVIRYWKYIAENRSQEAWNMQTPSFQQRGSNGKFSSFNSWVESLSSAKVLSIHNGSRALKGRGHRVEALVELKYLKPSQTTQNEFVFLLTEQDGNFYLSSSNIINSNLSLDSSYFVGGLDFDDFLMLRSGPGTKNTPLLKMYSGTQGIKAASLKRVGPTNSDQWVHIHYRDEKNKLWEGWAAKRYLFASD